MRFLAGALIAIAVLASAAPAGAYGLFVDLVQGDALRINFNGQTINTKAGAFDGWLGATTNNPPQANGDHLGYIYCIDLTSFLGSDPAEFTVTPHDDATNYYQGLRSNYGQVAWLANTYGTQVLDNNQRAGLQVAIWNAAYGNAFAYSHQYQGSANYNSTRHLTDAAFSAYQSYYTTSLGKTGSQIEWYDYVSGWPKGQDMVRPVENVNPVPEPTSLLLLGMGLIGGGAAVRRKNGR